MDTFILPICLIVKYALVMLVGSTVVKVKIKVGVVPLTIAGIAIFSPQAHLVGIGREDPNSSNNK